MSSNGRPIVLIVEDNLKGEMRDVWEYLEETGKYNLECAETVQEAKEKLNQYGDSIRVVLLDIILPIGDCVVGSTDDILNAGITLYQEVVTQLGIATVVLSCRDDQQTRQAFENDKKVIRLIKPVYPDEVESAIDRSI